MYSMLLVSEYYFVSLSSYVIQCIYEYRQLTDAKRTVVLCTRLTCLAPHSVEHYDYYWVACLHSPPLQNKLAQASYTKLHKVWSTIFTTVNLVDQTRVHRPNRTNRQKSSTFLTPLFMSLYNLISISMFSGVFPAHLHDCVVVHHLYGGHRVCCDIPDILHHLLLCEFTIFFWL